MTNKITERITGHTELIGLIATPIRHSLSPTMHNELLQNSGLIMYTLLLKLETKN
ncbi:hypothetical protein LM900701_240027 [Listeria monocytogenes]|nr:hypothetical protein LM900701_240027 [Listeria monocytogenes]